MRKKASFSITQDFTRNLCIWLTGQPYGMMFLGVGWNKGTRHFAGVGKSQSYEGNIHQAAKRASEAQEVVFCTLNYDLKNQLESLHSQHAATVNFLPFEFYTPELLFYWNGSLVEIEYDSDTWTSESLKSLVHEIDLNRDVVQPKQMSAPVHRVSREEYLADVRALQAHIQRGDIYQGNYCQEFIWDQSELNSGALFYEGFKNNPNPFSVFVRNGTSSILSFSPERFLKAEGRRITSQPMKGTAPRFEDPMEDYASVERLKASEKDRRENVMIVDMVRNDLSHFAERGSVEVPELYQVDTYPRVHQMHSTVTSIVRQGTPILEAVLKAFPMGSMTGAPKIRAMQLLDELEHSARGMFSGSIGYILPDGNADFNVVIRTLIRNEESGVMTCHAGGGITALSNPEEEYEESLLKAKPIFDLLESFSSDAELPLNGEATATSVQ